MTSTISSGKGKALMTTLSEIIESVKRGEKPDYDDLRFGLLVLTFLHNFDMQDMLDFYGDLQESPKSFPMFQRRIDESYNRSKRAMNVPPKDYLGENWNPDNPEYQKQHQLMSKLVDKMFKDNDGS